MLQIIITQTALYMVSGGDVRLPNCSASVDSKR